MSKASSFTFDENDFTSAKIVPRTSEPLDMKLMGRRSIRNAARIDLNRIITRAQVREEFDEEKLQELADSLKNKGQQQPIRVFWDENEGDDGRYVVLMGERRFRAAQMAGFDAVECIIHEGELSEAEITELQLIENLVRQDLNPIEEAKALRKIMDDRKAAGLPSASKDLAKELGFSDSKVMRSVRLLTLPEDVQADVASGVLPPSVVTEILKVKDEEGRRDLIESYKNGGTREEITKSVKQVKSGKKSVASSPKTKRVFSAQGIKLQATAKKRVTHAEIAEVLEMWLSEIRQDGRSKAA